MFLYIYYIGSHVINQTYDVWTDIETTDFTIFIIATYISHLYTLRHLHIETPTGVRKIILRHLFCIDVYYVQCWAYF